MVDIHCDETDDDQSRFIEVLAAEALRSGIAEKATASHTCAMHSYNNAYTYKLFKLLGLSKVNFISCPTENIHLQGRFDNYPQTPRPDACQGIERSRHQRLLCPGFHERSLVSCRQR